MRLKKRSLKKRPKQIRKCLVFSNRFNKNRTK